MASHQKTMGSAERDAGRLLAFLRKEGQTISPLVISTHNHPDPDGLASAFALRELTRKVFGMRSLIVYNGTIARAENKSLVRTLKIPLQRMSSLAGIDPGHVALVDTQPAFANNSFDRDQEAALVIDQHSSPVPPLARFSLVNTRCGATSVILAQALFLSGMAISRRVATALVYGIISDTSHLLRAKSKELHRTYLALLERADLRLLAEIQNPRRSRASFLYLQSGIRNARESGSCLVSHLKEVDSPDYVSQVADFLVSYQGMEAALCTGRFQGVLHLSLRLKGPPRDAGAILRDVLEDPRRAGGHDAIAGGQWPVGNRATERDWRAAEERMATRLRARLQPGRAVPFVSAFNEGTGAST
jgi:nanoRNase/pAp phosphatase (c-di-AMP/oligoRNAs hydrolase)